MEQSIVYILNNSKIPSNEKIRKVCSHQKQYTTKIWVNIKVTADCDVMYLKNVSGTHPTSKTDVKKYKYFDT